MFPKRVLYIQSERELASERAATATVKKQADLQHTLDTLARLAAADGIGSQMRDLIQSAIQTNDELDRSLREVNPTDSYTAVTTPRSAVLMQKVLDIPELLELLLGKLSLPQLFGARTICRDWKAAIDASPMLQRMLCYSTKSPTGHFRNPFDSELFGIGFEVRDVTYSKNMEDFGSYVAEFEAQFGFAYPAPRSIGFGLRKMLICQSPPITSMAVWAECCEPRRRGRTAPQTLVTNDQGLTVGDLYDFHQSISAAHQHCTSYYPQYNAKTGESKVEVKFRGSVEIPWDDPYAKNRLHQKKQNDKKMKSYKALREHASSYNQEKKTAEDAGEQFPTFQEWKMKLGVPEESDVESKSSNSDDGDDEYDSVSEDSI